MEAMEDNEQPVQPGEPEAIIEDNVQQLESAAMEDNVQPVEPEAIIENNVQQLESAAMEDNVQPVEPEAIIENNVQQLESAAIEDNVQPVEPVAMEDNAEPVNLVTPKPPPSPPRTCTRGAWKLRRGNSVILNGRPCKIQEIIHQHDQYGNSERHLMTTDMFRGNRWEEIVFTASMVDVPIYTYKEYQLDVILRDKGRPDILIPTLADLYDRVNGKRKVLKIPDDDLGRTIREEHANEGKMVFCTVLSWNGDTGDDLIISTRSNDYMMADPNEPMEQEEN